MIFYNETRELCGFTCSGNSLIPYVHAHSSGEAIKSDEACVGLLYIIARGYRHLHSSICDSVRCGCSSSLSSRPRQIASSFCISYDLTRPPELPLVLHFRPKMPKRKCRVSQNKRGSQPVACVYFSPLSKLTQSLRAHFAVLRYNCTCNPLGVSEVRKHHYG